MKNLYRYLIKQLNNRFFQRLFFILFLLSIFIIKIPPFYLSLSSTTKLFTTHVLAKFLLLAITLRFVLIGKIVELRNKVSILVVLFYLISQSISAITAVDMLLFLKDYQSYLFLFFIYIDAYLFSGKQRYLFLFVVISGFCMVFFDALFIIFQYQFISAIKPFIQKEMLPVYVVNLDRDRFNLYLNTELFLSFFLSSLAVVKKVKFIVPLGFMTVVLISLCIASNFRHRLFFAAFVLSVYGLYFMKNKYFLKIKHIKAVLVMLVLGIIFSFSVVRVFFPTDIGNRLLLEDDSDIKSIGTRVDNFYKSANLFFSSPILGVGLGNYQMYNKPNYGRFSSSNSLKSSFDTETLKDPHSIISKTLSETGAVGMIFWIIMIIYFVIQDFHRIVKGIRPQKLAYITAYWGFFLLSLITPSTSVFRGGWTWFLRGIIEGDEQ